MPFFKRKKEKASSPKKEKVINREEILTEIEQVKQELNEADKENKISYLNKIGSLYLEIEDYDQAISYYETSISEKPEMGKAFTDLTKLYNIKRKEASEQNDNEKVQHYLAKSDELMKLTKDTIRGNI
ncbi:tetratricopeptide repeat protein [Oceanobacillus jeddahense]|uniref:Tetratricopeptide repeat protein n=1 Tax=Oceanobacillus jeddahense TaxID=1462527 RepID=A0ABY5JU22_9BACI|nr:tetratricopeptide repeat protein [Oceanobacillus jeddahense]UUI03838.1 tetratricopeptide repeat protein [Oceanobacillus jeddahense]